MVIYVGNLHYGLTEDVLASQFQEFGEVSSSRIVIDRETNRSKGFGFIEMPDDAQGALAIKELDGREVNGRAMRVSKANPSQPKKGPRNFDR
ncbi:MAG: RNA recognition motif domain-containing protein [Flavobacteriales bacterium]